MKADGMVLHALLFLTLTGRFVAAQLEYESRLHLAAKEGWPSARVQEYIDAGVNVNGLDRLWNTPLHLAAQKSRLRLVNLFLDSGSTLDGRNKYGKTPLMLAASSGAPRVVRALIKTGADLDLQDKKGLSALMWAATNGHTEVVMVLMDEGAKLDLIDKTRPMGETALMKGAKRDYEDIVEALAEAGANVCVPDLSVYTSNLVKLIECGKTSGDDVDKGSAEDKESSNG